MVKMFTSCNGNNLGSISQNYHSIQHLQKEKNEKEIH